MVDVSVIMPIYNVGNHLEKAIQSVLKQTHHKLELILVNDGSSDNSGAICDHYHQLDQRVKVIHQENQGSGPARNAGLQIAAGDYIYFADPDDYVSPTLIEDNLKIAEEHASDIVVFGYFQESVSKNGQTTATEKKPAPSVWSTKKEFRENFRTYYAFSPYALWNKLYKKAFLQEQKVHFSDQRVGQDALFNQLVWKELQKVAFNDRAYYHYVYREGSAVNRYRTGRFELEYRIAKGFEQVLQSWGYENTYRDLIHREYWNALYLELLNLTYKDSFLTKHEKTERIRQLLQNPKVKTAVHSKDIQLGHNPFVKLLVYLVKKEKYGLALQAMNSRVQIGKKQQSVVHLIKKAMGVEN